MMTAIATDEAVRMKITDPSPVAALTPTRARTGKAGTPKTRKTAATADTASVMGIPEAELTPHVRAAITMLMEEVARLRDELRLTKRRISDLEELADTDALLPVINRRAFVRELSRMMSYAERYGTPHTLIYFDLNGMKAINDSHGHAAGDAALIYVAGILNESTRESDVVGRLGGDEFGVLLAQADETTAREKAEALAERISSEGVPWKDQTLPLSVAYGVHPIQRGQDIDDAIQAADRAMYANKGASRRSASGGAR
jgi:diguanylate cyclase (GGDEF)-like protein